VSEDENKMRRSDPASPRAHSDSVPGQPHRPRNWWILVPACLSVSLVLVAYPWYVIRPFRAQGARELAAALLISRIAPLLTVAAALAAVAAAIAYWRVQASVLARRLVAAGALLACVLAMLSRANMYEILLFHPLEHPSFAAAAGAKLDDDDKLIAVKIGRDARAYPIREMAYHHVVNDVVGGTALAATY
jgi:hypothetical protein